MRWPFAPERTRASKTYRAAEASIDFVWSELSRLLSGNNSGYRAEILRAL